MAGDIDVFEERNRLAFENNALQARIAELEATVAALGTALTILANYSEAHDISPQSTSARRVLANLPQAVQRHLARDRTAGEMDREIRRWWPEMNDHIRSAEAAYRAASKEEPNVPFAG